VPGAAASIPPKTKCQSTTSPIATPRMPSSSGMRCLSGVGVDSPNFHLVFLPAACFLSREGFSVVVVVAWVAAIERRVINLLPYPSLLGHNWRVAVGALGRAADDHVVLLKTSTHIETRFSLCSVGVERKECVLSSSFVCRYGQCEREQLK